MAKKRIGFILFILLISFNIWAQPTVTSVTPSPVTITDSESGGNNFTLAILWSEPMNTAVTPTVAFNTGGEDPVAAGMIAFSSSAWSNANQTYTVTYAVTDTDVDMPNIDVYVSGGQNVGAVNQVGTQIIANNFSVKFTNPTVTGAVVNFSPITDANIGAGTFAINLTFSEQMNAGVTPVISFPTAGEDPTTTISTNSNSWPIPNTEFQLNYTVTDNNDNIQNIDISVTTATDTYGNIVQPYSNLNFFSIDMNNATVTSVTPSTTTITDANIGVGAFTLTVVYDKVMNTGVIPVISYPTGGENPLAATLSNFAGAWSNNITFVGTYDVADANEEIANIDVRVTGGQDPAGNTQNQADDINNFSIDTRNPSVTSVVANVNPITDANSGAGNFSLTITYNENMDGASTPTITFPVENPLSTIAYASGSWTSATSYEIIYDVTDANQNLANIDVSVAGGQDPAGNGQTAFTDADNFSIDMLNPTVSLLTPNLLTITDANTGASNFTITIDFSEAMLTDGTANPVITFPVENPLGTITLAGAGSWSDANTYVATYNVADANENVVDIDVQVTLATDVAGNTQVQYDLANVFSINMNNPTVTSVTPNVTPITDANIGPGAFTLTVVYNQAMNTTIDPVISYPTGGEDPMANTLTYASGNWPNNTTFVVTYNVTDANEVIPNIDIRVDGAQDVAANAQIQYNEANNFSIDTDNPTVLSAVTNLNPITDADAGVGNFTITLTYSKNMDGASTPTIVFPVENPLSTLSLASGSWTDLVTYVLVYDVTDANQTLANIDVRVTGASDPVGNTQNIYNSADHFSIDMQQPTVVLLTPNPLIITDADAGAGNFTITVDFSEAMITDGSANPVISFPIVGEDPTGTIAFVSPGTWFDADTYIATYNVTDINENIPNIDVRVDGAQDLATNPMVQYNIADRFSIDMNNPTLNPLTIISNNANNTSLAMVGDIVTITFTASKTLSALPVATIGGLAANVTNVGGLNYTATRTLTGLEPEGITNFNITFSDVNGNNSVATNTDITDASSVTFDFTAPTDQNVVFAASVMQFGGSTVNINTSGNINNKVWFAPIGQIAETDFTAGATMTQAVNGFSTTILAPTTANPYRLYVIDEAGNVSTASVAILTVDNTPILANIEAAAINYTENDPATQITNTITVADDSDNIVNATIQITGNYQAGQDILDYTGAFVFSWNAITGTLTINGPGTKAQLETALRAVTYENTSNFPSTLVRTVSFTINDGFVNSNTTTRDINVAEVNDLPVFTSIPVTVGKETVLYTYDITATDADDVLAFANFTLSTGPAWLSLNNVGPGLAQLSGTPPVGGTYGITITCDDGRAGITQQIFNIIVADAWVVDAGGGGDFLTIQGAIDASITGDSIIVVPGIYNENINFNGKEIEIIGNTADPTQVIIDGGGAGSVVTFANGESGITALNGFTIRNGGGTLGVPASFSPYAPASGYYGGGIYCYQSNPLLKNIIVENNNLGNNNNLGGAGAGIYIARSTNVHIEGPITIIQNNSTIYRGGGICIDNSTVIIDGLTGTININNNSGGNYGGGMATFLSDITLTNVNVDNNDANGSNGDGGGIFRLGYSVFNQTNVNFNGNTSTRGINNDIN